MQNEFATLKEAKEACQSYYEKSGQLRGCTCGICPTKPPMKNEPQLSAELKAKYNDLRPYIKSGVVQEKIDDVFNWFATALEEQKQEFINQKANQHDAMVRADERQKVLAEVEGLLVDVDTDKVDNVFYEEALIKNSIYAELRAKLAEMKEGKMTDWKLGESRTLVVSKTFFRSPYQAQTSVSKEYPSKYFNVRRYDYACGFDDKKTILNHDLYWYFKVEPNGFFFSKDSTPPATTGKEMKK